MNTHPSDLSNLPNLSDLSKFPSFFNNIYQQEQQIPNNQSSVSNFSDISNQNIQKMIDVIKNSNNPLISTLYKLKLAFDKQSRNEEIYTCNNINAIIRKTANKTSLIQKITYLNWYGISIFFDYGTCDNPNDGKPYVFTIGQSQLPFPKNYYFDGKYNNETAAYSKYVHDVLTHLNTNYNNEFGHLDVSRIHTNVNKYIQLIAPYIISNVNNRDILKRFNKCKLHDIIDKFPNLELATNAFMNEYFIDDKNNVDVLFTNNILIANKSDNLYVNYHDLSQDEIQLYDNGDYYWHMLNILFEKYYSDNNIKTIIDDYIVWTTLNHYFSYISENTRKIKFDFYSKTFSGQKTEKPLDKRIIHYLQKTFPELIGELFCEKYFTFSHKSQMTELIDHLLDAYKYNFNHKCNWIDNDTKNMIIEKLNGLQINNKIGYPEKSSYAKDYKILDQLLAFFNGNNLNLMDYDNIFTKWHHILDIFNYHKKNKNMDKWGIGAMETNAYYHSLRNEIVFPAGILQKPFFVYIDNRQQIDISDDNTYTDRVYIANNFDQFKSLKFLTMASNFGSIGAVIGHEISHAFDDNGSKFDANGKLTNGWSEYSKTKYNELTNKLINQFDNYTIDINIDNFINTFNINGKLTLGENIADLFGLRIAIDAYKSYYEKNKYSNTKSLNDGLLELFVAFINTWRYIESPIKTKNRISTDVHAPPYIRIIGTLKNIREFYEIFDLKQPNDIIDIFIDNHCANNN